MVFCATIIPQLLLFPIEACTCRASICTRVGIHPVAAASLGICLSTMIPHSLDLCIAGLSVVIFIIPQARRHHVTLYPYALDQMADGISRQSSDTCTLHFCIVDCVRESFCRNGQVFNGLNACHSEGSSAEDSAGERFGLHNLVGF